jgi:hypothetical protein
MTMNVDNLCQSCGYPLNRDEHGGVRSATDLVA